VTKSNLPAEPSRRGQVTGRLKAALDLMVFGDAEGKILEYDEAAKATGMTTRAMRMALHKPHVRNYLRDQRGCLIASLHSTNVQHVASMRANSANSMTRLQAARMIEDMAQTDAVAAQKSTIAPGITIIIGTNPPPMATFPMIEGRPANTADQQVEDE
jgi:hypothetical protein